MPFSFYLMMFIGENTCGIHLVAIWKLKTHFFRVCFLKIVWATQCVSCEKQEQLLAVRTLHQFSAIIFHDGVYLRKHRWGPSSGNLETKNTSFFRSCFLHFMCAAQYLSRYKLPLCILRDGFVCTYFLALY